MKATCTVHPEHTAKALALRPHPGCFLIEPRSRFRDEAHQAESSGTRVDSDPMRKTFMFLPAVYLNRPAHERPVYLSPRFEDPTRWCGGGWRRGNLPALMSLFRDVNSSRRPQRGCTADRNMVHQTEPRPSAKRAIDHSHGFPDEDCMSPASILRG
jgi:hypothetical protein